MANRVLGAFYTASLCIVAPHAVDCGPGFEEAAPPQDPRDVEESLGSWFPDYSFQCQCQGKWLAGQSTPRFQHEDLGSPDLRRFSEAAGSLLAGSPDVFELAQRIRGLTDHGSNEKIGHLTDPSRYLQAARSHEPLWCYPFALIHCAACVCRGYTARVISLSGQGSARDHATVEVYVPDLGKWILIDPDFNVSYRRGSEWLDARELHEAWLKLIGRYQGESEEAIRGRLAADRAKIAELTGIEMVALGPAGKDIRQVVVDGGSCTGMNLELFRYVAYPARNDYFSGRYPPGHPIRSTEFLLMPEGEIEAPATYADAHPIRSGTETNWAVGRCSLRLAAPSSKDGATVAVSIATWTPNFSHFEFHWGDGLWQTEQAGRLSWRLVPGDNRLAVRSVNGAGLKGELCELSVRMERRGKAAMP